MIAMQTVRRMAEEAGIQLYPHPYNFTRHCTLYGLTKLVNEAYKKGAAAEREACAKVCEERFADSVTANDTVETFNWAIKWCAASIRARGQG